MYQQVKDINLSKESPCGHGIVTCFSIYGGRSGSGEACNFAADPRGPPQDRLWVDTMLDDQVCQLSLVVLLCYWFVCVAAVLPLCYHRVICHPQKGRDALLSTVAPTALNTGCMRARAGCERLALRAPSSAQAGKHHTHLCRHDRHCCHDCECHYQCHVSIGCVIAQSLLW